ncbi:MAG TPA: hypothetical protein VGY54_08970 [Polyangiaceae bacterium]|jgi:hypothetical protein|nr:hypothetical protein [Polyangiaceae bacterium]
MEGETDDANDTESASSGQTAVPTYIHSAWQSWLSALATDAEAAAAAALTYESLSAEARDAWLDALALDGSELDVPAIALYAPLLAVEADEARRDRIEAAIAADPRPRSLTSGAKALRGIAADGLYACVLVVPLYLDFVQVLRCRYTPSGGFVSVCHDPLRHAGDVATLHDVDGVSVEPTPLGVVVEDLAYAILAEKRQGRLPPQPLASVAHLFAPDL